MLGPRDLFVSMNSTQPENSVYIVRALAIATVVTMELEVAAAVQSSLLLRCGDIEVDPGPLQREGEINDVILIFGCYIFTTDVWFLFVDLEKVDNFRVLSEFIVCI